MRVQCSGSVAVQYGDAMIYRIPIDPREVPPEPPTVYCPECDAEDPEYFYRADGDIIGCSECVKMASPEQYDAGKEWEAYNCPFCGAEADYLYEKDGAIIGCPECVDCDYD